MGRVWDVSPTNRPIIKYSPEQLQSSQKSLQLSEETVAALFQGFIENSWSCPELALCLGRVLSFLEQVRSIRIFDLTYPSPVMTSWFLGHRVIYEQEQRMMCLFQQQGKPAKLLMGESVEGNKETGV